MMRFNQAPHRAMLSYATIRSSQERKTLKEEAEQAGQVLHACIYGAGVTLIGGFIMGACAVMMVR